jgi:hypothetical protein
MAQVPIFPPDPRLLNVDQPLLEAILRGLHCADIELKRPDRVKLVNRRLSEFAGRYKVLHWPGTQKVYTLSLRYSGGLQSSWAVSDCCRIRG